MGRPGARPQNWVNNHQSLEVIVDVKPEANVQKASQKVLCTNAASAVMQDDARACNSSRLVTPSCCFCRPLLFLISCPASLYLLLACFVALFNPSRYRVDLILCKAR